MRKEIKLKAQPVYQDDPRMNRTTNILGALALALSDRIASETGVISGMSPSAASALIQVHFYPGISVEQLKSQIGLSHSASVRVIDLLEDAGHLGRRRITEKDEAVLEHLVDVRCEELGESGGDDAETVIVEITDLHGASPSLPAACAPGT